MPENEMRYVFIFLNRDPDTGQQELLNTEVVIRPVASMAEVVWDEVAWLDGIDGNPVGRVEQDDADGAWYFPGDHQLRVYVQVG